MTVESRKRSFDDDSASEELDVNLSDNALDQSDDDINIDQMLTQHDPLKDRKKRAKLRRHYEASLASQRMEETLEDNDVVAGVIKSVHLENFMCHENFELEFGPRLNFIIGHNGSGKSAILTAISVCLGAKASETNRAGKLHDLIKEGKNTALVRVVLTNEGSDAYEPAKYGKTITIERRLKRDTQSCPYIIKSENGKQMSNKKPALDALLDHFNITVSNPMVFLSQDMARAFLTASTDEQKYKYFMKGTMMEETLENFKKANEQQGDTSVKLLRMRDDVEQLRNEAKEANKLHEKLKDSNGLRIKQRNLYGKYFWLEADQAKSTIQTVRETEVEYQESIQQLGENIDLLQEKIEHHDEERAKLLSKKEAIQEQLREAATYARQANEAANTAAEKAEAQVVKLQETRRTIANSEKQIRANRAEIAKEEEKIRKINGGSKDLLREQLQAAERKAYDLQKNISTVKSQLSEIDHKTREEHDRVSAEIDDRRQEALSLDQQISRIKGKATNAYDAYHPNLRRVMRDISNGRFTSNPIGPLGAETAIKEEYRQWSHIINSIFGKNANTFVVENFQDQRTLQRILEANNLRDFAVVVRRRERFNYSQGIPDPNFLTMLDVLTFKNEDAKYALIDLIHIESLVLIADKDEARSVIRGNHRNVLSVATFATRNSGTRLQINQNGAFSSNPIYYDTTHMPKILMDQSSQNVTALQEDYSALKREIETLQKERADLTARNQREKSGLRQQLKELESENKRCDSQIFAINRKLEEDVDSARLEVLLETVQELETSKQIYENSIADIEEKIVEAKAVAEHAYHEFCEARTQLQGIQALKREYDTMVDDSDGNLQINISKREHFIAGKKKREKELETLLANIPQWEERIREHTENAMKHCSREVADSIRLKDIESVKREIEKVTAMVEKANEALGKSPEQIIHESRVARQKYGEAYNQFMSASYSRKLLAKSIHERIKSFRESRGATCYAADLDFKTSLQFRNFTGNLEFDFVKGKLKMLVSTKNDKKPRHVDSLSGGEKSFSQIALLLATWKPMRSRIKGLDEFDVFMDQVNRKIGMRLMLSKLSEDVKSQTIFITPQDIGQIAELDERYVRIHRIRDPRAGQAVN